MPAALTRDEQQQWRDLVQSRNSWHAKFDKAEQLVKLANRRAESAEAQLREARATVLEDAAKAIEEQSIAWVETIYVPYWLRARAAAARQETP